MFHSVAKVVFCGKENSNGMFRLFSDVDFPCYHCFHHLFYYLKRSHDTRPPHNFNIQWNPSIDKDTPSTGPLNQDSLSWTCIQWNECLYKDTPEMRTSPLIRTPCMVPAVWKSFKKTIPEMRTPPLIRRIL